VPIAGKLAAQIGPPLLVSGQIDRLAVTKEAVLIADYKTNRPAPHSLDELLKRHGGYVRQLALYRAVLAKIYANRVVRAALIWTDRPDLMEIPDALMDEEIARLTAA
jgi:ATP-dependent helicase/nuclease subunit A